MKIPFIVFSIGFNAFAKILFDLFVYLSGVVSFEETFTKNALTCYIQNQQIPCLFYVDQLSQQNNAVYRGTLLKLHSSST